MYTWTDGTYLAHHGIKGQRWGVRRFQNEDGSYTAAGKERRNIGGRVKSKIKESGKSVKSKWNGLSDEQRTAIKVGAAVVATALVAYGAYKIYENGQINKSISIGKEVLGGNADDISSINLQNSIDKGIEDAISSESIRNTSFIPSEKAIDISNRTGIPLKTKAYSVAEDIGFLAKESVRTRNDCGPLALNFALRRLGLDATSCGNDESHLGGLSFNELGNYFRGIARNSELVSNGPSAKSSINDVISKQSQMQEGAVGLISLIPKISGQTGHFTSWVIENGKIKFPDVQTGSMDFMNEYSFDNYDAFRIVRLDTLEVNTRNLFGNPFDLDIQPIVKKHN